MARMLSYRIRQAAVTILFGSLLVACGGDGESDPDERTGAVKAEDQVDCEAEVTVSGSKKASWTGEGFVITGGELGAFYKTSKGKRAVSVYAEADDISAYAVFSVGNKTFTTQGPDGVEVAPDGTGATVDAEATGTKPKDVVQLVASIEC